MFRGPLVTLALSAALVASSGCGGGSETISAETRCKDYLAHDEVDRNDAAVRLSSQIEGVSNPGNPMWRLSLDAACGGHPSLTLGEYFGAR